MRLKIYLSDKKSDEFEQQDFTEEKSSYFDIRTSYCRLVFPFHSICTVESLTIAPYSGESKLMEENKSGMAYDCSPELKNSRKLIVIYSSKL